MIPTTITTKKGAQSQSNVYVVDGYHPEPLLGAKDAESLGFVTFNAKGRDPETLDTEKINKMCSTEKIRNKIKVKVETTRKTSAEMSKEGRKELEEIVDKYKGLVFDEKKIGKMKCEPIHLDYEKNFKPKQPNFHNIPIQYQKKVSELLDFLRQQNVITDVDPKESFDCVMNTVITDKKNGTEIRMNIDNTPQNPGMKRTQYHIQTPQEIRHDLKEAKFFSEMDMGFGYHQLPIDEATKRKAIFQTHEGVHRMERLYFGPTSASGIFHNEIRKSLRGVKGSINIHDNLFVWGNDEKDHNNNLRACLERCYQNGITLKLSKSTFGMTELDWFGRLFTTSGVTADDRKIQAIIAEGRPKTKDDVRSFLMACQFNAKFLFDHPDIPESYEEITLPLRNILKKDNNFSWSDEEENSYKKLVEIMKSPATLRPFSHNLKTHLVADASEVGIQASLYQCLPDGTWVPIDHCSRALTATESGYSPIERESLAQSWGMNEFRYYLVGGEFEAWTDHDPILPIYNNFNKKTSKRISNHRDNVSDLQYTMRYMPGKEMPCDYGSRCPNPISHLSNEEMDSLGFDTGNKIHVMKINFEEYPDSIDWKEIKSLAKNDQEYLKTMTEISKKHVDKTKIPPSYKRVIDELCITNGMLFKGDQMVIPNAYRGQRKVQDHILDMAHQGHADTSSMKRLLRTRVWFPGMDNAIHKTVGKCLACQASTPQVRRDPLIPSEPPLQPWESLGADHWGPTPDGKYILVVIDMLSKYPEVLYTDSTSADENIEILDNIMSRNDYCRNLRTDNGPPWNSHAMKTYLKWAGINHQPTVSAEDPEANGLAESFMKHLKKIYHTSIVEGKNPRAEINHHLRMFRSTPHPSTGQAPGEIHFNRPFNNRLTRYPVTVSDRTDISNARKQDQIAKQRQKFYKDQKSNVKHHNICVGDQVLLKQKSTKMKPPYDPYPYKVTEIHGHQITAIRDHTEKTRDSSRWKKVTTTIPNDYSEERSNGTDNYEDYIIDLSTAEYDIEDQDAINDNLEPNQHSEGQEALEQTALNVQDVTNQGSRSRSTRISRPPKRFGDYELY